MPKMSLWWWNESLTKIRKSISSANHHSLIICAKPNKMRLEGNSHCPKWACGGQITIPKFQLAAAPISHHFVKNALYDNFFVAANIRQSWTQRKTKVNMIQALWFVNFVTLKVNPDYICWNITKWIILRKDHQHFYVTIVICYFQHTKKPANIQDLNMINSITKVMFVTNVVQGTVTSESFWNTLIVMTETKENNVKFVKCFFQEEVMFMNTWKLRIQKSTNCQFVIFVDWYFFCYYKVKRNYAKRKN